MINNNTIVQNRCTSSSGIGGGIYGNTGATYSGVNNIIYFNEAAYMPQVAGPADLNYSCSSQSLTGTGNITDDPLFVDLMSHDYNLQSDSPCIDTGDPSSPLDPDSTRADMGALYFDQGAASPVTVTLMPYGTPIQIPAAGGSFDFNIEIANTGANPETFDIWTMVTLPNGIEYGPIINVQGFTAPANWLADRDRTQAVPGGAPAGNYTYDAYVGIYPDDVWNEDHFDFEKLAVGDGNSTVPDWSCWGESFNELTALTTVLELEEFEFLQAYPNPFNPKTQLTFSLPRAGQISLIIYDVRGGEIARLIDRWSMAGEYTATFDASHLPTGVYFVRLTAGDFQQTQKLLLIK